MTTIEKMVRGNSELLAKKFTGEERVREFEKVAEEFEELVKKRMINKKGSRLSSITDAHIYFKG